MDAIFPLKSKKSIKAVNQVVNHNNIVTRLKIQNALYQQELNRVKAANDSANAALALAQQQARDAAQKAAHDVAQKAAHDVAQKAAHDAAQQNIANNNNKKSTKFGKLLSKMNKQH